MNIKRRKLNNGITMIYHPCIGELTSFTIALDGGALAERKEEPLGIAHMVEHMVFKGTKDRTESEINAQCDEVFGFHNAMTNYPYVIYYGTTLASDFERGLQIYADLLINPIFPKQGFEEERAVIFEELGEWKEEPNQECEDELYLNGFPDRRIKDLIIGTKESVKSFTLEQVRDFYNQSYAPENCVISVVSSLEYNRVAEIIERLFNGWERAFKGEEEIRYEKNKAGIFVKEKEGLASAKIQYAYPIDFLSSREQKAIRLLSCALGEGTSSLLYDEIRTKNGLAYDISSIIKNERGIKLLKIAMGTSKENINKALELIDNKLEQIKNQQIVFSERKIAALAKGLKLKKALKLEKTVVLSVNLAIYERMEGNCIGLFTEEEGIEQITSEEIHAVANKVIKNPTIQVLTGM